MKNTSSRNTTSVIEAIEKVAIICCGRFSAMSECGFVEKIHEIHRARFHAVHEFVHACNEVIIGEHGNDAHYESGHGGYQSGVDAGCEGVDCGRTSG